MAPDYLRRSALLIALALAACGGGDKKAADEAAVDLATLRAKRDSVHQADSLVRVKFAGCSDSVLLAMGKTAAGKKKLATKPPEGMIRPEILTACGKPPVAPMVEASDSSKQLATAPAAASQAPGMTPQQLQVQRADSIRKERERMRADSLNQRAQASRQDSLSRSMADSVRGDSLSQARETEVSRETFTYGGGARDPFVSLIATARIGPEFSDLTLLGIYLDNHRAGNSIAVLRDKNSNKRYNLRVGDQVGRLRVAQIRQRDVVFTVEDIGFERQETLSLRKREEETP